MEAQQHEAEPTGDHLEFFAPTLEALQKHKDSGHEGKFVFVQPVLLTKVYFFYELKIDLVFIFLEFVQEGLEFVERGQGEQGSLEALEVVEQQLAENAHVVDLQHSENVPVQLLLQRLQLLLAQFLARLEVLRVFNIAEGFQDLHVGYCVRS